jgi:hypothetical protein
MKNPTTPTTSLEQYRRECEARHVMRTYRTVGERMGYFDGVRKARGEAALRELQQEIKRQAELRREKR